MKNHVKVLKFSPVEQRVIDAIPPHGKYITSTELLAAVYGPRESKWPFHARVSINTAIRNVIRKLERNGDDRWLERTEHAGPHPMKVRLRHGARASR